MPAADLTTGSVHVDAPMTQLAISYGWPDLVAEKVLPPVPVNKESDVYYQFNKEELQEQDDLRADGTTANELSWDVTSTSYLAEEYALRKIVTDRVIKNADPPVRPVINTVSKLKRALMIEQERRVQAIVQSAAVITNTSAIATKWDAASPDPDGDVNTAKLAVLRANGTIPNAILFSYEVSLALMRWLRRTAYTTYAEWLNKNEVPPILWGLETIVAGAVRNTANPQQTEVLADIWNDNVLVFYKEGSPSLDNMSLGYIIRAQNWQVINYREEARKGTWYEASVVQDEVVVAADAGYLLTDAIT